MSGVTTALYPGSFDPVHNGHVAVIELAAPLFSQVIVGVGHNPDKSSGMFTPDERVAMIEQAVAHLSNIRVALFTGLVTAAAGDLGADCLLKGLRGASDLDGEMQQAHMNRTTGGIPTVFLPAMGPSALVASSYVRQIASMGGDVASAVPTAVLTRLQEKFG
jgi:pantetheine-phosphate adenylyltransferase